MITIKSDSIEAAVSERGAELQSLKLNGREYLWNGDASVWQGRAPVLFPICGGVKNNEYGHNGKTYSLAKHGFARISDFQLESRSAREATLLLRSNEATYACYPFGFEFRVRFAVYGDTLVTDYIATNTGGCEMPFSVGAHEGFACPEGIGAYDVIFEAQEDLWASALHGNLVGHEKTPVLKGDTLALDPEYFAVDALVFTRVRSRLVTLRNRLTGRGAEVRFDNFPYLLLWQKYNAPYICIEPWCGLPDFTDSTGLLRDKAGIITAAPGRTVVRTHTVRPL